MGKGKAHQRPPKPAFAMIGVVAGTCTGMVIGFIVEIVRRRSMIVMQAGGIIGIAGGALGDAIRL